MVVASSPSPRWRVALDAVPLLAIVALGVYLALTTSGGSTVGRATSLTPVDAASASELEAALAAADYAWPPIGPVPRLAPRRLPGDLSELPVARRKALFFSALTPLILAENEKLRHTRAWLEQKFAEPSWTESERLRLTALAERYSVGGDLSDQRQQRQLLRRLDEIPLGLALAQAATESGWGTSRFAQEASNLFGVWTWNQNEGLVPAQRQEGQRHLVRVFPDLRASVANYMHTLNTGAVYAPLRQLRAQQRAADQALQPLPLTAGLEHYSERRQAYVQEIRHMIRSNGLDRLDDLQLAP